MCPKIRAQAKEATDSISGSHDNKSIFFLLMLAFLRIYTADSRQPPLQLSLARARLDVTSPGRGIQLLPSTRSPTKSALKPENEAPTLAS